MESQKFFSITALVINEFNLSKVVLGVSRKDNLEDFGLPGGKIEPGETPEEACIREIREETGLEALELVPIYDRTDAPPDGGKLCRCFLITKYTGAIKTKEKGIVKWIEPTILGQGTFGYYNTRLIAHIFQSYLTAIRHRI